MRKNDAKACVGVEREVQIYSASSRRKSNTPRERAAIKAKRGRTPAPKAVPPVLMSKTFYLVIESEARSVK